MDYHEELESMITSDHLAALKVCCVKCKTCNSEPQALGITLYCYYIQCKCERPANGFMASDFIDCIGHWNWYNDPETEEGEEPFDIEEDDDEQHWSWLYYYATVIILLVTNVILNLLEKL